MGMRKRSTERKSKAMKVTVTDAEEAPSVKAVAEPKEPAHHGSGDTRVSSVKMTGFENIIDSVFSFDPEATYEEVKACLSFGQQASRTDYGALVDALDDAEENARKALQLVANAKVAAANYVADVEIIKAELHEQSVREVFAKFEDPNDDDVKRKPTVADIEAYKVSTYHDEWSDIENRVQKAKRTVDYLEGLAALTAQRARDLRQMVASCRGA